MRNMTLEKDPTSTAVHHALASFLLLILLLFWAANTQQWNFDWNRGNIGAWYSVWPRLPTPDIHHDFDYEIKSRLPDGINMINFNLRQNEAIEYNNVHFKL